jgi:hypothetical protein
MLLLSRYRFSTNEQAKDQMPRLRLTVIHSLRLALILGVLATSAFAQPEPKPKRVRAPATIRALVGGEHNDWYVVHVRKGRLLTVQISWKKEKDFENTAGFSVSASPDGLSVSFGKYSNGSRKWTGRTPKTGDYFIEVNAHPFAHYVLQLK